MKDTRFAIKQEPSFSSNLIYLSKLWLPYQLNQDPNTLYHEAVASIYPSTHIYWVPLDERMFVVELCKLKVLSR